MQLVQLSEKLRLLSSRYRLTQEDLGSQLGIAHTTVGRWLAGKSRPYDRHALTLAKIFSVKPEELIDDEKELPARLLEDPIADLKKAGAIATAKFPNDQAAGQALFDALNYRRHWEQTSLETAAALRTQAAELIAIAENLEAPFVKSARSEK